MPSRPPRLITSSTTASTWSSSNGPGSTTHAGSRPTTHVFVPSRVSGPGLFARTRTTSAGIEQRAKQWNEAHGGQGRPLHGPGSGATGMFGGRIARGLLDAGQPVRAPVRDREKAKDLEAAGAELAVADMDQPESLGPALDGIDRVVPMFGAAGDDNVGLIAAGDAAAAGVALLSGHAIPSPGATTARGSAAMPIS